MASGVMFDRESAERIARTVRKSEGLPVQPHRRQRQYGGGGDVYRTIVGKADGAIAQDASGTVSIWSGTTSGGLTDSTENITAYARMGAVTSGAWVYVIELPWGYEVYQQPCA